MACFMVYVVFCNAVQNLLVRLRHHSSIKHVQQKDRGKKKKKQVCYYQTKLANVLNGCRLNWKMRLLLSMSFKQ